jgi:hypothetical protein
MYNMYGSADLEWGTTKSVNNISCVFLLYLAYLNKRIYDWQINDQDYVHLTARRDD